MAQATAALLTTVVRTEGATLIDAIINGKRTWLRFADSDQAGAQGDIVAAHASVCQAFVDLQIPNITPDTRVLLDVRCQVEAIAPTILAATQWSCPPQRHAPKVRNVACQHLAA